MFGKRSSERNAYEQDAELKELSVLLQNLLSTITDVKQSVEKDHHLLVEIHDLVEILKRWLIDAQTPSAVR